jgi:hypothetical protein
MANDLSGRGDIDAVKTQIADGSVEIAVLPVGTRQPKPSGGMSSSTA